MTDTSIRQGLMRRRTAQKGLTLAETLMVLAIGAVAIVGGTILYMQASRSSKMNQGIIQLATLSSQIRTVYSGQSTFGTGDMVPSLAAANAIPADMRVETSPVTMKNAWGGAVTAVASVAGSGQSQFIITMSNVPADACVRLPTINSGSVGGAFAAVSINGTSVAMPVTLQTATGACNSVAAGNTLAFTYQ